MRKQLIAAGLMAFALIPTLPSRAAAQGQPATTTSAADVSRVSVAFNIGGDVALSGDLHDTGTGLVLGLPAAVMSSSYKDVYGTPFTWSIDVGYMFSPQDEARVRLVRSGASGDRVEVGTVGTFALFAQFDDYEALGLDFGYRRYFSEVSPRFRPFVGASLGFLHVDEINSTFTAPAASVVLPTVPMYESSVTATFTFGGGVLVPMTENLAVQAGIDFRRQGGLEEVDGLAGTGLETINDNSGRWTMPLTIGAVYRF